MVWGAKRRGAVLAWALRLGAAALLCAAVAVLSRFPLDDAFIHLRIARNLALHGEPYFNLGEPVLASSSPLWLLLLAAVLKVHPAAGPGAVAVLECLVVAGLFLTAERLFARLRGRSDLLTALAAAALAAVALQAAGGLMETALALLLLTAGALAFHGGRFAAAGALLALGAATRFELALPGLVLLAIGPGRKRLLAGAAPVVAAEVAFLLGFYGTLVPNTIRAKALVFQPSWDIFLHSMLPSALGVPALGAVLLVLAALAGAVVAWRLREPGLRGPAWAMASLPIALLALYLARQAFVFSWYMALVFYPAGLAAFVALFAALRLQAGGEVEEEVRTRRARRAWLAVGVAGATAWCLAASFVWNRASRDVAAIVHEQIGDSGSISANARSFALAALGRRIAERCPSATVMAPEIGAIGWGFPGRIVDAAGVGSPELLPYHPLKVPEERFNGTLSVIPAKAVADLKPDVVVAVDVLYLDFMAKASVLPGLGEYRVRPYPLWEESLLPLHPPELLWGGARSILVADRAGCDVLQ